MNSIAIVGAGAVGGYYGARLAQHGADVHFLLRSDYEAVKKNGWRIKSIDGDFSLPAASVHAYNDPRKMPATDLVIVTLKATDNRLYESLISPLLHEKTIVLTLQNGLGNEERLADLFGAPRIVGGLAFTCINRVAPGEIHHIDYGFVRIGEMTGPRTPRVEKIAAMFNASKVKCDAIDDLAAARWDKLVWNIPFNGLGALFDATTDRLIATEDGIAVVRALMEEVIAIARSQGANLPADLAQKKIDMTRQMGAYLTSMQIDRRNRRAMEIEAILGRPLQIAQAAGLATPRLQQLYFGLRLLNGL